MTIVKDKYLVTVQVDTGNKSKNLDAAKSAATKALAQLPR